MFNWLFKGRFPSSNGPHGPSGEREAFTPTLWQRLTARGSDNRVYEIDHADLERLRPVYTFDERAQKNRKLRAEQQSRRRASRGLLVLNDPAPVSFVPDDAKDGAFPDWLVPRTPVADTYEDVFDDFVPPKAELLPAAPRSTPDQTVDEDWIVFPSGEGNGHRGV